ncbi:hypothetical protein LINPERPRIM_LOCUS35354, partial [Linum perenne]
KNRILQLELCRPGETIHRQLHKVLQAVRKRHHSYLQQPKPIPENSNDPKWKFFKNCLGSLDGTHVRVRVRSKDQTRYRDRKGALSMNVLARWEGSAHGARVLRDALSRPNRSTSS